MWTLVFNPVYLGGCNGVLLVLDAGGSNRVAGSGSSVGRGRGIVSWGGYSVALNSRAGDVVGRVVGISRGRSSHSNNSEGTHFDYLGWVGLGWY